MVVSKYNVEDMFQTTGLSRSNIIYRNTGSVFINAITAEDCTRARPNVSTLQS